MQDYRPWLPLEAVTRGVASTPIVQAVSEWSIKWFVAASATVRHDPVVASPLGGDGWTLADGVGIVAAEDARRMVGTLLFGAPEDELMTPADEEVIGQAADTCLADLRTRLATAFRLPTEAAWRSVTAVENDRRRWTWRVEAKRSTLLNVLVDEDLIIRRIRAGLPPAVIGSPLTTLVQALAPQAISVSALVGRCRLTTAELKTLSAGDVVVLDRSLAERVELAVDRGITSTPCKIEQRDDRLDLILVD